MSPVPPPPASPYADADRYSIVPAVGAERRCPGCGTSLWRPTVPPTARFAVDHTRGTAHADVTCTDCGGPLGRHELVYLVGPLDPQLRPLTPDDAQHGWFPREWLDGD